MHLIYEALKKTGGKADGDALIAAMKGMSWESPRGPISIDPQTRDIVQNIYIRKVEKKDGELYNVEFATFEDVKDPVKAEEITAIAVARIAAAPCSPRAPRILASATSAHMLTILFDGIAYGMLLFVLACGLVGHARPDELRQPRARRLRHGGRLRARSSWSTGWACRSSPRCRSPSCSAPLLGARARAHALRPRLRASRTSTRCCSRSASSSCRSRRSTTSWARSSSSCSCRPGCRASSTCSASASAATGCSSSSSAACSTLALQLILSQHALRQPAARRGRRSARRARARHQCRRASSPLTFAFGSGLAGLGGALGAEILGLDPTFPLKFMIYFLIVVTVGGTSSITGPFLASLLLGIADVAGKYYVPHARRLRHLHDHDRGADLAAAGPVRARGGAR